MFILTPPILFIFTQLSWHQKGSRGVWLELFGYWTGSKGLWLDNLSTGLAPEALGWNFGVLDWLQRPVAKVFGYKTGSRGLWLEFLGTGLALEAPDWNLWVPDRPHMSLA